MQETELTCSTPYTPPPVGSDVSQLTGACSPPYKQALPQHTGAPVRRELPELPLSALQMKQQVIFKPWFMSSFSPRPPSSCLSSQQRWFSCLRWRQRPPTRGKRLMVLSPALGKDPSRGSFCPQNECQWWVQGDFPKTRAVLSNVQRLTDPSAKDSSWRKSTQMQTLHHQHFYSFWPGHVGDCRLPH